MNVAGSPRDKQFLIEEMGGRLSRSSISTTTDGSIFSWSTGLLSRAAQEAPSRPAICSAIIAMVHSADVTGRPGLPTRAGARDAASATLTTTVTRICLSVIGAGISSITTTATVRLPMSRKSRSSGSGDQWGAGCCFLDYDRDGHLDLFVANYVNFDASKSPRPGESAYCRFNDIPVPCGPQGLAGGTNVLYRNRGDGTFEDVSAEVGHR